MSPIKQELLATIDLAPEVTLQQTLNFLKQQLQPIPSLRTASGRSILRHAGKWEGDDFEDCLQSVYNDRSEAKF